MQDTIVILFMLFLRIGVPLAVTIGAGYLIQRWLYKDITLEAEEVARGKIIPFERHAIGGEQPVAKNKAAMATCWEVKNCALNVRESCPAYPVYLRSGRPCWMTFQLGNEKLREECLTCEVYQLRPAARD